jgi:HlyD family secretion protein
MTQLGVTAALQMITKHKKRWLLVVAGLSGLVVLLAVFALPRGDTIQYLTAKVEQGEIRDAVDATGTVNAVITVTVGSQVSGTIAKLNADFNSRVHKGDVIALIDPSLLQGTLLQATADLETAKANVVVAEANLAKAAATFGQAKADYDRAAAMAKSEVITPQELDLATSNYQSAKASRDAAAANVTQANAQARQKGAAVSVARTTLNYTVIRSPIDGIVVARNVDVGQTVAASLQAPTIFTIAQDLTKMQVYAKVDESDVGRIKLGQPASFKVDAFPRDTFQGVVSQIRMNPTSVQNVVTYDAIIDFANPELKLFPGMTAYVTIPVARADNVVKLPNVALRFKPPMSADVIRALYEKYGLEDRGRGNSGSGGGDNAARRAAASPERATQTGTRTNAKGAPQAETAVVWKLLTDHTIVPVKVALGITDHAYTEVTALITGDLKPGDDVVTTSVTAKSEAAGAQGFRR